jgi:hypothetical protein
MRQDPKKPTARPSLVVKRETLRTLDHRTLDPHELAQVAGGTTYYPRHTCNCTG